MDRTRQDKSIILAYVAWFFLSAFGVHRFYLGRIKTGLAILGLLVLTILMTFIALQAMVNGLVSGALGRSASLIGTVSGISWAVWCLLDLILIPIMVIRDRRAPRAMSKTEAAQVFE